MKISYILLENIFLRLCADKVVEYDLITIEDESTPLASTFTKGLNLFPFVVVFMIIVLLCVVAAVYIHKCRCYQYRIRSLSKDSKTIYYNGFHISRLKDTVDELEVEAAGIDNYS